MTKSLIFFCLLLGFNTSSWAQVTPECSSTFQPVGGHCIHVSNIRSGSWQQMRDVCQGLKGDLPNLKNANFLADINDFLIANELNDVNYWVGSNDQMTEGAWSWVDDNSMVKMGTPLWGDLLDEVQEPSGGASQNCGVLLQQDHFYMHAADCNDFNSLLCEEVPKCGDDFQPVGDRCLLVGNTFSRSWQEIRNLCLDLGGDYPNLSDANFLADINDYLIANGLNDVSYWVGSTDESTEGEWLWVNDQSHVKMGSPLWGDLADEMQQPTGGTMENCGVLLKGDHHYMHDAECTESYSLLCEKPKYVENNAPLIPRNAIKSSISAECPFPYEMVYGKCLFINTLAKESWNDQMIFCNGLGGFGVKITDANFLGALSDHLSDTGISSSYFIGGYDQEKDGTYMWPDGTPVRLGPPFWGDDVDQIQEPDNLEEQLCLVLFAEFHYRFGDYQCDRKFHVICQKDI